MTSQNPTHRQNQLRKVAILVATLGEPLAEQLLADLPARDAAEVRTLLEDIDEIEATEYDSVVTEFRQGKATQVVATHSPTKMDGVELDASLQARLDSGVDYSESFSPPKANTPWLAINEADTDALAEILSAEQPQTIAVVLARLESSQASEVISKLQPALQADVLNRITNLDPADEQSLQVVESQLAAWIDAKDQKRQRMAAGYQIVERILSNTPESQRSSFLEHLGERNPQLASQLASRDLATQSPSLPVRKEYTRFKLSNNADSTPPPRSEMTTRDEPSDPLLALEALSDQALLKALQSVDRQTVMLALAGASESVMKRIVRGLPRRQANKFRQQVRTVGPTRLSDMVAAQRELIRCSQA